MVKKGNITHALSTSCKRRYFTLSNFDESLAQGYVKLIQTDNGLGFRVIDTYNQETIEQENEYLENGYIKIGYPSKKEKKEIEENSYD